jgi:hypothetical protein
MLEKSFHRLRYRIWSIFGVSQFSDENVGSVYPRLAFGAPRRLGLRRRRIYGSFRLLISLRHEGHRLQIEPADGTIVQKSA